MGCTGAAIIEILRDADQFDRIGLNGLARLQRLVAGQQLGR